MSTTMKCKCGALLLMASPKSTYSICSRGCGKLREGLSESQRVINHATLAGVREVEKYCRGYRYAPSVEGDAPLYYKRYEFKDRDVAFKPLKPPAGYVIGRLYASLLVLVPAEIFWHEVDYDVHRAPPGMKRPASIPLAEKLTKVELREWDERYKRAKGEY